MKSKQKQNKINSIFKISRKVILVFMIILFIYLPFQIIYSSYNFFILLINRVLATNPEKLMGALLSVLLNIFFLSKVIDHYKIFKENEDCMYQRPKTFIFYNVLLILFIGVIIYFILF